MPVVFFLGVKGTTIKTCHEDTMPSSSCPFFTWNKLELDLLVCNVMHAVVYTVLEGADPWIDRVKVEPGTKKSS